MDSQNLYRVQREDLPKLEKLLNLCFAHDPLYETLIPNAEIRKKLNCFIVIWMNFMRHVRFFQTAKS